MAKRAFCFFDWVIIDNCNLNCAYCVNKGLTSQKPRSAMEYVPGIETRIAERIVRLSETVERVHVNLTGGEPTTAQYLPEALAILARNPRISVQMVSNLKDKALAERTLPLLSRVNVSLHVAYRNNDNVSQLIELIREHKDHVAFSLSQVDYQLGADEVEKLARIRGETGLGIHYDTFIPPWTKDDEWSDSRKSVSDKHFRSSLGKRCALGYFVFYINPDGKIRYGLWCREESRKEGDFLSDQFSDPDVLFLREMQRCPHSSCGCNYNLFNYKQYLAACQRDGYPSDQVFEKENRLLGQKVQRALTRLRVTAIQTLKKHIRRSPKNGVSGS